MHEETAEEGKSRLIIVPKKALPTHPGQTQYAFVDLVEETAEDLAQEGLAPKSYTTPKTHAERCAP
jgi:hypothetical protein